MTKITYIPGEIANAAIDEHGNRKPVTRTHHIFDDAKDKNQAEVNAEVDDTFAFHQSEINALNSQNYVTVDSFSSLPATGAVDTVYRVSNWDGTQQDPSVYSEYAWNGESYVHLSTKTQIGEVFDISAYHATGGELAKYADLAAALGNNGANVPQELRRGGMSVKYVQTSDNKYVQYRLMFDSFSTAVSNWQGVDDKPMAGSNNLVKSGGVKLSETHLAEKVKDLQSVEEDVFAVTDNNGNACVKYDQQGFDVIKVSEGFKRKFIPETYESGAYLIDKDGNVGIGIEPHLTNEEEGIVFCDKGGNVIKKLKDNVHIFSDVDYPALSEESKVSTRINSAIRELKELKNSVGKSIESLLPLKEQDAVQSTFTTTIDGDEVKNNHIVRLRLHYGSSLYTPDEKDIFFNGSCKKDFSDIRFFDSTGKILKASFGKAFNMECVRDTHLNGAWNILVTSDGKIIKGTGNDEGVLISSDNGEHFTVIPNTYHITENASETYHFRSIMPIMLDSNDNIFGYAGGKLYKMLASDNYATITEVLDFSWVEPTHNIPVYPDIQNRGMSIDINGNIFMGTYQSGDFNYQGDSYVYYNVGIYVSTDGGNSFVKKYHSDTSLTGFQEQHVHHIHADKYTSRVYVGIDCSTYPKGPKVMYTDNGGNDWVDITYKLKQQRGHDFYPSYFGQNYKIGSGEAYCLGGNSIFRGDTNDNIEIIYNGFGGVRQFVDFGDDSVIVGGINRTMFYSENQIVVSHDQGKSFEPILRIDSPANYTSGDGFRDLVFSNVPLGNDTEPCILLRSGGIVDAYRLYNGGNHYYREVEILLDDVQEGQDFVITAKTGYQIPYPYENVRPDMLNNNLAYEIPFDEGCGRYVHDSVGNIARIPVVSWELSETMRKGEHASRQTYNYFQPTCAAKIKGETNFGKISNLNFAYNYTLNFWINEKARKCNYTDAEKFDANYFNNGAEILASFGNCDFIRYDQHYAIAPRGIGLSGGRRAQRCGSYVMQCTDDYLMITFTVMENGINCFLNGVKFEPAPYGDWDGYKNTLLSSADLVIGSKTSDFGYISNFRIYSKVLSDNEIIKLYKSFNY